MRTTLDLDDRVLQFARAKARAEHASLGHVISELALIGVAENTVSGIGHGLTRRADGLVTITPGLGRVVTDELVSAALEQADREDAGVDA